MSDDKEQELKYYSLAKVICHDIFMDAQLQTAGSNQARLLEKYAKSSKTLKRQFIAMKIIYSFVFMIASVVPITSYFQIIDYINSGNHSVLKIVLGGSLLYGFFFLIQLLYLIIFGLLSTSSLMTGQSFKWLETLPIQREDVKKLVFASILRTMDLPLIIMIFFFPIIMFIFSLNIIFFLVCLGVSLLNTIFAFSLLIFISEKMNRLMVTDDVNSKKQTTLRMIMMFGYIVMALGTSFLINWGVNAVGIFFEVVSNVEITILQNILFSLILFPFTSGYLISLTSTTLQVPLEIWLFAFSGIGLFILITRKVFLKAIDSLKSITSYEGEKVKGSGPSKEDLEEIRVKIITLTPIKAYIKKDLITATRDIQTLMFLIMPVILPFITILSMTVGGGSSISSTFNDQFIFNWILTFLYVPIISGMLISGLLNMEESGTSILASLPIIQRDQAKGKLIIMLTVQIIAYLLPVFILNVGKEDFLITLTVNLVLLPLIWIFLLLFFEMKISLFGKMKYKYVIEEVRFESKTLKWILMMIVQFAAFIGLIILIVFLTFTFNIVVMLIIIGLLEFFILLGLTIKFDKMFPKIHIIK